MSVPTDRAPISAQRRRGPQRFQTRTSAAERGSVLTAIAAAVALLVLVVGVPALLLWLDGVPQFPTSLPSRDDLTATIGVEQLLTVLVWVAWLAWLQFVLCVAVELRSAVSGIGLPSRVPLSGPSQRFARVLVSSVLLAASAVGPAAASQQPEPADVAVAAAPAQRPGADAPTVPTAGQPAAEPAPVEYRLGDVVLDADTGADLVGRKVYRVQPPEGRYHDNLWDIAERELGEGRRYREIFELNRGRTQPDGHELSLARLIYPHWLLIMPEDATVDRVVAVTAPAPVPVEPPAAPAADEAAAQPDIPADDRSEPVETESSTSAGELATAGLLAAGLLAAVEVVRRRRRTPEPDDDAVEAEVALRVGADPQRAAALDRALRLLAAGCQAAGRALPPVFAAIVGDDRIEVLIAPASPNAPSPWQALDDGRRWVLERDDGRPAVDALAPFPGLVSLGRDDLGRDVLVDLEAAGGPVAVVGDPTAAHDVVTALAAELATNSWSDHLRVTGYDLPAELAVLEGRYRQAEDLGPVLRDLAARRADPLGTDVLTGRLQSGGTGAWMPEYLVLGAVPDDELAGRLVNVTVGARRSPLGVICAGDLPGARWRFAVDAAGTLDVPALGLSVRANRLSRPTMAAVAALIVPESAAVEATLHEQWLPEARPPVPPPTVEADAAALATAPARVFLLGPAEVQAAGPVEADRKALGTEIVVHLALHRDGVHPTVLAAAIWPRGVTQAVREATFARVREWLGLDPDGSPYLRQLPDGRLRLSNDVLVDWDVVCTLLRRSRSSTQRAEEIELLRQALRVARGPVLSDRPPGRYSWLARVRLERIASDLLVDAAHRLSVLSRDGGQPGPAAAAARAGLRVRPAEQLLWRDLVQAEHAARGRDGVVTAADELARNLDELGIAAVEPETTALLEDLLPAADRTIVRPA
jgi:hypothetical protein